jgi:lipopolysaccharide transport system ATP-binding protein
MKPILDIQSVSKKFRLRHEQQPYLSLRDSLMGIFKRDHSTSEEFMALDNISFSVEQGESVGIIGKNGAGKSTLLKVLSRITPPSSGKVVVRGRIASLLEVGTGFHPELTGRENIFFNGSILGMKHREIVSKFDEIVDFSGTEKFLDTPLKHFSSGMQLRLAFSVAAFLDPEILVIDEVLSVGDAEFQKKCIGKMEGISKSGRTILFVSHNMGTVAQLCPKTIMLRSGRLHNAGPTEKIIDEYINDSELSGSSFSRKGTGTHGKDVAFERVYLSDSEGKPKSYFSNKEPVVINIRLDLQQPDKAHTLFVMVLNKFKTPVFCAETPLTGNEYRLRISEQFLTQGNYSITAFAHIPPFKLSDSIEDTCSFEISDLDSDLLMYNNHGYFYGSVFGKYEWLK